MNNSVDAMSKSLEHCNSVNAGEPVSRAELPATLATVRLAPKETEVNLI